MTAISVINGQYQHVIRITNVFCKMVGCGAGAFLLGVLLIFSEIFYVCLVLLGGLSEIDKNEIKII